MAKPRVRTKVIEVRKSAGAGRPRARAAERKIMGSGDLIAPPFDPLALLMMPEESSHLGKCIEAYVTNIAGFGATFRPVRLSEDLTGERKDEILREMRRERVVLANTFRNCVLGDSFLGLSEKTRRAMETLGYGFWEVIQHPITDAFQFLKHVQAHRVRMSRVGPDLVPVDLPVVFEREDGTREIVHVTSMRWFRRFALVDPDQGQRRVWFKEWGDPRDLDAETGEFAPRGERVPVDRRANALIHWSLHSDRTPYGLPRYIGVVMTIRGDRAAERVNFVTLKNNNVPSLAFLVSNGQLTAGSVKRIRQFVEEQASEWKDNRSKILIVEAEAPGEDGSDAGTAKLTIERLTSEQMKDQLFQEYGLNNERKIRGAFRLPAVLVGDDSSQNRANATESTKKADEQVFAPERHKVDEWMNLFFLPRLGIRYHDFLSYGPNVTDPQTISALMSASERTGGMTPETSRQITGEILGRELPPISRDKVDPETPFSLQMAERVKNMAGGTVGEQVTALKSVDARTAGWLEQMLGLRAELDAVLTDRAAEFEE